MGRRDGVARPKLPPGPLLDLNNELHELHLLADCPSMRDLSRAMGPGVLSHTTVHETFVKAELPRWGVLELVVEELADRIPELDPQPEVERFRKLWRAARLSLPRPADTQEGSVDEAVVSSKPTRSASSVNNPNSTQTISQVGETVYFAMSYGARMTERFGVQNFDELYADIYAPAIERLGLKAERVGGVSDGSSSPLDTAWNGIQRASVVVIDFTIQSSAVAMACAWAMALHKRMIVLVADGSPVPSSLDGQFRILSYRFDAYGLADAGRRLEVAVSDALPVPAVEMRIQPGYVDHELATGWAQVEAGDSEQLVVRDMSEPLRIAAMTKADLPEGESIQDLVQHFPVGTRLFGTFRFERATGMLRFIHQPNAWTEHLVPGQVLPGRIVRYVSDRGYAMVDLGSAAPVSAFVHATQFNGLEPAVGMEVSARIDMIDTKRPKPLIRVAISKPS
ncbi:hypothetical protein ABT009_41990 [Streptomyces sp. NPDC002896]|uniref:hypothetical protein n=1 Tax=Streptomyces sp. NPDC002896 TaxID=3154438 RepID=UPI003317430A